MTIAFLSGSASRVAAQADTELTCTDPDKSRCGPSSSESGSRSGSRSRSERDSSNDEYNRKVEGYNSKMAEARAAAKSGNYKEGIRLCREALAIMEWAGGRKELEAWEGYAKTMDSNIAVRSLSLDVDLAVGRQDYADALTSFRKLMRYEGRDNPKNREYAAYLERRVREAELHVIALNIAEAATQTRAAESRRSAVDRLRGQILSGNAYRDLRSAAAGGSAAGATVADDKIQPFLATPEQIMKGPHSRGKCLSNLVWDTASNSCGTAIVVPSPATASPLPAGETPPIATVRVTESRARIEKYREQLADAKQKLFQQSTAEGAASAMEEYRGIQREMSKAQVEDVKDYVNIPLRPPVKTQ